ncbi:MAG: hypothetical protein IPH81_12875 [Candidatus Microthrix sp.]|nr:hypothetical protein [Candidatus Microthrix sp.]
MFGQLPPADWLLGVTRGGHAHLLLGTGIGIIPGAVVCGGGGGGLIRFLLNLPAATAVAAVAALAIGAAGCAVAAASTGRPTGWEAPSATKAQPDRNHGR